MVNKLEREKKQAFSLAGKRATHLRLHLQSRRLSLQRRLKEAVKPSTMSPSVCPHSLQGEED